MTREEALNAITAFVENYAYGNDLIGLKMAIEALKERPHGEWMPYTTIDGYTKHATCTNCGYKRKVGMGCSLDVDRLPNFCEKCGADMRDKKDDLAEIIEAVQSIKEGEQNE